MHAHFKNLFCTGDEIYLLNRMEELRKLPKHSISNKVIRLTADSERTFSKKSQINDTRNVNKNIVIKEVKITTQKNAFI